MSGLMSKVALLEKEMAICTQNMNQNINYELNKKKFAAIQEMVIYLLSLDFISDTKSKNQMLTFIQLENENIYSTSVIIDKIAKHFNYTDRTIRNKVSKMDNAAEEIVTSEIINLLKEENIDDALSLFSFNVTKNVDFSNIFFDEFLSSFPIPENNDDLKLIDCMQIIIFAKTFVKANISLALKNFGLNKAAFFIYVLTGINPQYNTEKKLLLDLFSNRIDINDFYEKLNSSDDKVK